MDPDLHSFSLASWTQTSLVTEDSVHPVSFLISSVQNGTLSQVNAAIASAIQKGVGVNVKTSFGSTALHCAVWRNHIPIIKRLITAGADLETKDNESGWTCLHRAMHFGHLAAAAVLLEAGASLSAEDRRGRTPIDLLAAPVQSVVGPAGGSEVYSWGNGANYQLGTGTAGILASPSRIAELQGLEVCHVAAARFHSAALTRSGCLLTWGFGRGGRLGHSDFDIHSGQVAVIYPRLVSGLKGKRVASMAAAKHHMVVCTESGEVFTWGSNRDGRLGYSSVDTQSTPRRVTSLKLRVVQVAASNKHTACVTESGEVLTWGCNESGQLGYGTSNSASSSAPKVVDSLRGRQLVRVAAAKYHTIVLTADGEVYTWGYGVVTPRRVAVVRDSRKAGQLAVRFHRMERVAVTAVAAGFIHSTAVTDDGMAFVWASGDPHLKATQIGSLSGHHVVAVSAGKYRTAVVTLHGDVFVWDGDTAMADAIVPAPVRVGGLKQTLSISVGERHSVAVAGVYFPQSMPATAAGQVAVQSQGKRETFQDDEEEGWAAMDSSQEEKGLPVVPSLKDRCQAVIAQNVVDPRNVFQFLEMADALESPMLKKFCEMVILRNLAYVLTVAPSSLSQCYPSLLVELESALRSASSQPWIHHRLPSPTAPFQPTVLSDTSEEDTEAEQIPASPSPASLPSSSLLQAKSEEVNGSHGLRVSPGSLWVDSAEGETLAGKQLRAVKKKLQQIENLERRQSRGEVLDAQQRKKLATKGELEASLHLLMADSEEGSFVQREKEGVCRMEKGQQQNASQGTVRVGFHCQSPAEEELASREQNSAPAGLQQQQQQKDMAGKQATKPTKKKTRKGGLSMFLSGALEAPRGSQPELAAMAKPKPAGPAWGGSSSSTPPLKARSLSLADIISHEQTSAASSPSPAPAPAANPKPTAATQSSPGPSAKITLSLSELVEASGRGRHGRKHQLKQITQPAGWGSSPCNAMAGSSLKEIQQQQQLSAHRRGMSPAGSTPPASSRCQLATLGVEVAGCVSYPAGDQNNRWYRPDEAPASSLVNIQKEEAAMAELRKKYRNVRIVEHSSLR